MLDFSTLRAAGAAAVAASMLAAPAGADTLRLAHWVPPQHTLTASTIEPLIAATQASGLEIQVYPGGELGAGPLEQYARALTGVADIVWGWRATPRRSSRAR